MRRFLERVVALPLVLMERCANCVVIAMALLGAFAGGYWSREACALDRQCVLGRMAIGAGISAGSFLVLVVLAVVLLDRMNRR